MSAAWSSVLACSMMTCPPFPHHSATLAALTLWVRGMWASFADPPAATILQTVSLSSLNLMRMHRRKMASHSRLAGRHSVRIASSAATISASGVLWETQVCLLDLTAKTALLRRPRICNVIPVVLLCVRGSPANIQITSRMRSDASSHLLIGIRITFKDEVRRIIAHPRLLPKG